MDFRFFSINLFFYKPICLSAYQHNKAYLPIRIYVYSPLHVNGEQPYNLSFYKPICPYAYSPISVSAYQHNKAYLLIRIYVYSPLHVNRE